MKSAVFPMSTAARKGRQSMALILTLAILAILSILLVSFVSMSTLDRGATKSFTQALPADQIALGGLDQIVSQFQAEIADPALSTPLVSTLGGSNNTIYIPLAAANSVPQRTAPPAANMATLLTYSGTSVFTKGAGMTDYSSSALTQTASLNGRLVSTSRWNKPQLTTSASGFPDPKWILMTRGGPQSFSTYTSALGNSTALNGSYVVGRYAYVVYDTSGLLDANVAGYPTSAVTNAATKGLMPWADLTQLGVSQADVDSLVNWRNATTSANYGSNVLFAATNNGFTRVANGDTCFLSRQELIKYAETQNLDLSNALPYLTTFSREANGPTWGPVTPSGSGINYASQQYATGSLNPRIPNPRVQTAFTRNNGLPALVGEPLVKYRFPLDKLALLEKFTGSGSLTADDITNIQKYFGLDLASDCSTMTSPQGISYRHWNYPTTNPDYPHGKGTSGATGIMSLDDVASVVNSKGQGREPDFFELLQAGILSGSLGAPGTGNKGRYDKSPVYTSGSSSFIDPDDSATLQLMRIGANIIDQWDADSFPTTVTYTPKGGSSIDVEGIEDLPYPFAAYFNVYASNTGLTGSPTANIVTALPPFNFYLYFSLWNPHQTPPSPVASNYPTAFRFYPFYNASQDSEPNLTCCDSFVATFQNGGIIGATSAQSWAYNGTPNSPNIAPANAANQQKHNYLLMKSSAPSGVPFSYSPTVSTNDYREPALAVGTPVGGTPPAPWSTNACLVLPPLTNFPSAGQKANHNGSIGFPATSSGNGGPNAQWACQYDLRMVMPIQYQDTAGNWHTYSTFMGLDDQSGAYPNGTYYEAIPAFGQTIPSTTPSLSCGVVMKSDPRTFRFGGGFGSGSPDVNVPLANNAGMVSGTTMPPLTFAPFGSAAGYRIDLWAQNDSTTTSGYSDVDGVRRWGDARNSYKLPTATSPVFAGQAANRPVILNRPFQSVGDLGYVYRDMPWKTLDLFSANSADSGLLDLFTVSDQPILAGRVNPNTPYAPVLAALISGATQSTLAGTTVSSANAQAIAQALTAMTATTPFVTRTDMVNNFMTNSTITSMSAIKTEEESAVRAVAESANTRTWTFLIDIIAQSGRYPTTANSLDNFAVDGERRYWLHVSIDRYTGQVVDKQLEVVNE